MSVAPQASLYETTIENASLEAALEELQKAKERAKPLNKQKKDAKVKVQALADELDLADGPVRVGRFVLKVSRREENHVEFDVAAREQLSISLLKDLA